MPSREGLPWLLDEYVLVADLFLRGGDRAMGNPEVVALAHQLGRSPGSISRRLANFVGTEDPGHGLKPITGEALEVWLRIKADPDELRRVVASARARLSLLARDETSGAENPTGPRLVDPEEADPEPVEVVTEGAVREAKREEAALVRAYREWLDPRGSRLRGILIPTPTGTSLRVDLYDTTIDVLIEAKAKAHRGHLREAVGQLLDYRRYLPFVSDLAVLVPEEPSPDLMGLLSTVGAGAVWRTERGFADSRDGYYFRRLS